MLTFVEVAGAVFGVMVIIWLISIPIEKHKQKVKDEQRIETIVKVNESLKKKKEEEE